MKTKAEEVEVERQFAEICFALRSHTATLENLQGQIFDDSYRTGSLMIFRALILQKELEKSFCGQKFEIFKEKVAEIDTFIDELIVDPAIFGKPLC